MEINNLPHTIIGCAFKVHNVLGAGFLGKVYENARKIELDKLHISAQQQRELPVWYDGKEIGLYYPDLWVEDKLIIEVKPSRNW